MNMFKYCGQEYCRQEYCGQEYCRHFGTGMKILSIYKKKPKCRTLEEWLRTLFPRVDNNFLYKKSVDN